MLTEAKIWKKIKTSIYAKKWILDIGFRGPSHIPCCINSTIYSEPAVRESPRKPTEAKIGINRTKTSHVPKKLAMIFGHRAPIQRTTLFILRNIFGYEGPRRPKEADGS